MKFNTYCWKAFAAEKFLDPVNAKGLIQRTIELQCYSGDPQHDIAEVTDSTGAEEFQELKDKLNDLRNTLLAFRLSHFHKKIPDVKLNIKCREKQLFKPIIRIFQNEKETLEELLPVISKYVTLRREANFSTLHAFLYRIVSDIIKSRKTAQIESGFIWDYLRSNLQGADIPGKPLSYESSEFGTITQKEIIQILEHVFGARSKKSHGVRKLEFDISKLQRLGKVYDLAIEVNVVRDGDDSFEQNRGSDWTDWTDVGLDRHMAASTNELKEIRDTKISEHDSITDQQVVPPTHPPQAPHVTPDIEAAARLKEYERISALARKKLAKDQLPQPSKVSVDLNDIDL